MICLVQTRMQVQGELASKDAAKVNQQPAQSPALVDTFVLLDPQRIYRHAFHAAYLIAKNEGLSGLQGGLGPALGYQLAMNGTRLGAYAPVNQRCQLCLDVC